MAAKAGKKERYKCKYFLVSKDVKITITIVLSQFNVILWIIDLFVV